jgi:DNA-binding response OmpR family regulator
MNRILLVEDDASITDLLRLHFHPPGFEVMACERMSAALQHLDGNKDPGSFNLIILDILLPDGNGIDLCKRIRRQNGATPILMLSALGEETDKVTALEFGADDYLTKPFGIAELMARVRALLRRVRVASGAPSSATDVKETTEERKGGISYRELTIDRHKRKVTMRGRRLELTPKEFDLLWLLATHPGKTFTRHELLEMIWGFAFQEYEHTVTSHINRLRIKIEPSLDNPEYILTTWGAGYRFAE